MTEPSGPLTDIATSADGAKHDNVFAADMDRDGDMDIISASSMMIPLLGMRILVLQLQLHLGCR